MNSPAITADKGGATPQSVVRRKRSWYARNESVILAFCGIIPLIILWQFGGMLMEDDTFISSPYKVILAAREQISSGQIFTDTWASLLELFPGFGLSIVIGVPVGMLIGRFKVVDWALDPYIWFFYSAPIIAFYPLLIMWFGLGARTVIILTFIFAIFPIISNTVTGVQEVDRVLIRAARAFGGSNMQILRLVILPASVPSIMAGLRIGIGRALIGTVVGEFFGASAGLGYRVSFFGTQMLISDMFVPVLVVMFIGVGLLQAVTWLESRVETWRA